MYAVKLAKFMCRPCSVQIIPRLLDNSQRHSFRNVYTMNLKSQMKEDVVLFKLENPRFFIIVNACSGLNCVFWTYLGVFLFNSVREAKADTKKDNFWKKLLENERDYTLLFSALSLFFGWSVFAGTLFYTLRSVRKLILHKGGRNLTLITYKLPGFNNKFKVPLSEISSAEHRKRAKKYIPLKIKNKHFYYLLDIRGEFANPELFDYTAGIQRNI